MRVGLLFNHVFVFVCVVRRVSVSPYLQVSVQRVFVFPVDVECP